MEGGEERNQKHRQTALPFPCWSFISCLYHVLCVLTLGGLCPTQPYRYPGSFYQCRRTPQGTGIPLGRFTSHQRMKESEHGGFPERFYGLSLKTISITSTHCSLARISHQPTFTHKGIWKLWSKCAWEEKEMDFWEHTLSLPQTHGKVRIETLI